jgi:hypothetical protein
MSEDFMDDEFVDEEGGGSNRAAMLAAAGLTGLFILTLFGILLVGLMRRGDNRPEIASIEATNAAVEAANLLVTQTVAAMATEAARPTNTPTPTLTPIPPTVTPTFTPQPTDTPVVQAPIDDDDDENDDGLAAGDQTPTPVLAGTSIFAGGQLGATPTPISGAGAPGTGVLPETGLTAWVGLLMALLFMSLAFVARRLRTA